MKLGEKTALVTGASHGIGKEIALQMASEGCAIVIDYVADKAAAEAVKAAVEERGQRALIIQADVSKPEQCQRLVDAAVQTFGQVDILVNNVGIEKAAPFWEVTEADYDLVMNANIKSAFFMSKFFARSVMARSSEGARSPQLLAGKIINISSIHEDVPFPHFATYCVSKGGMRMLTRTLAIELGPYGISVNAIAPGAIKTRINAALLADQAKTAALLQHIPLGRIGEASDVAGLAVFLASRASDYMTAGTYVVDGGLSKDYHEQ